MLDNTWPTPIGIGQDSDNIINSGMDPRREPGAVHLYRALRDARSSARSNERKSDADPENDGGIPRVSEWAEVRGIAIDILSSHAKDIEVAVWLTEAVTRLDGFEGLSRSMTLIAEMVKAHGADLHPHPEDADDDTFAALGGLNGIGRPGTLLQPLRLLPLVPGSAFGANCLWDIEGRGQSATVRTSMAEAGPSAMRTHLEAILSARAAVEDADASLTALRGADAPPFGQIIDIIDDAIHATRHLADLSESPVVQQQEAVETDSASIASAPSQITSREAAFARLLEIAAYFREAEPHSPIADSLETLVRRGRMDFISLISELIPDHNTRESVLITAGIRKDEASGDE